MRQKFLAFKNWGSLRRSPRPPSRIFNASRQQRASRVVRANLLFSLLPKHSIPPQAGWSTLNPAHNDDNLKLLFDLWATNFFAPPTSEGWLRHWFYWLPSHIFVFSTVEHLHSGCFKQCWRRIWPVNDKRQSLAGAGQSLTGRASTGHEGGQGSATLPVGARLLATVKRHSSEAGNNLYRHRQVSFFV